MGRVKKKRFSENVRKSNNNATNFKEEGKVSVDMKIPENKYDSGNPLNIVEKQKKISKTQQNILHVAKPLSKKERKRLAKKKRKLNRTELTLSKVQALPEELDFLSSTISMQTHPIKTYAHKKEVMECKNQETTVMIEDDHPENAIVTTVHTASNKFPDMQEKVSIDIKIHEDKYDSNNPLVIVGKKKKLPKTQQENPRVAKPLSRKQKKKLQNILAKKKKKLNRAELLEKLSKVQAKPQELECLTSTTSMQTRGIKRVNGENTVARLQSCLKNFSNIKGSNTKENLDMSPRKRIKFDPNVVSCVISSSESDDEDSNDDNLNQNPQVCIPESSNSLEEIKEICDSSCADKKEDDITEDKIQDKAVVMEQIHTTTKHVPAVYVTVNRLPEIQAAREALPIFCQEQSIMEAISENDVVVIRSDTGSGKTTQVPQFLYEGGYTQNNKLIGITEPRRIAAMTMAARVATEMNLPDVVAYHVRYENNLKDETQIKFMTDGVLVKEIRRDFYLSRYSVIIIDEAHERSVYSDVLIGLLSRVIPLRKKKGDPLKLIIMSATIKVQDFTDNPRLFEPPPFLIEIDSRQYTVTVHFNKHTPTDYVEAAYHKVCKIHSQLPAGAILVFLTGEKEVNALCKMLRNTYPFKDKSSHESEKLEIKGPVSDVSDSFKKRKIRKQESDSFCSFSAKINLDDYSAEPLDYESVQHQISDDEDESSIRPINTRCQEDFMPLYTLPLYSVLPFTEQEKIFQPPPKGSRLCVVSTNVAETSITIPGLKYVVDSGKVKTKVYDKHAGGISQFCVNWTSKASANQRAGRAGRTEGGHCYRLYSSSVFEHEFTDFPLPEIQRIPVDDVLLQLKALGIGQVVNFPFPSPPENEALKTAEQRLIHLGALKELDKGEKRYTDIKKWQYSAKVTPLGKAMTRFPLSPRYAKMLILSYQNQVIPHMIAIISAMTVPEVFLHSNLHNSAQEEIRKITAKSGNAVKLGDSMILLRSVALFEESKKKIKFCEKYGIRHKAMVEIHKMGTQLIREMNRAFRDLSLPMELQFEPPSEEQMEKLRKLLTIGFTDHVARIYPDEDMKLNKALKNAYKCLDLEEPVFIHPSSVLFSERPQYIIYQEIVQTTKSYMKGIIEINPEWLPAFAPTLCNFSEPLEDPAPSYDSQTDKILCSREVTFGHLQWELPPARVEMPQGLLKYSWFACFLLEGKVLGFFKYYRKDLLSLPSIVTKSWAKLRPMTRYLLQALIEQEVDSKESLEKVWKKHPKFLLREYWEWLPANKHLEVEIKWPPKS